MKNPRSVVYQDFKLCKVYQQILNFIAHIHK